MRKRVEESCVCWVPAGEKPGYGNIMRCEIPEDRAVRSYGARAGSFRPDVSEMSDASRRDDIFGLVEGGGKQIGVIGHKAEAVFLC